MSVQNIVDTRRCVRIRENRVGVFVGFVVYAFCSFSVLV